MSHVSSVVLFSVHGANNQAYCAASINAERPSEIFRYLCVPVLTSYRSATVASTRVSIPHRVPRRLDLRWNWSQRERLDHRRPHRFLVAWRVRLQEQALEYQLLQTVLRLRQWMVGYTLRCNSIISNYIIIIIIIKAATKYSAIMGMEVRRNHAAEARPVRELIELNFIIKVHMIFITFLCSQEWSKLCRGCNSKMIMMMMITKNVVSIFVIITLILLCYYILNFSWPSCAGGQLCNSELQNYATGLLWLADWR